jgi:hypothetical protein
MALQLSNEGNSAGSRRVECAPRIAGTWFSIVNAGAPPGAAVS